MSKWEQTIRKPIVIESKKEENGFTIQCQNCGIYLIIRKFFKK